MSRARRRLICWRLSRRNARGSCAVFCRKIPPHARDELAGQNQCFGDGAVLSAGGARVAQDLARLPTVAEWRLAYALGGTVTNFSTKMSEAQRKMNDAIGWFGIGFNGEVRFSNIKTYYEGLNLPVPMVTNIWPAFPPQRIDPTKDAVWKIAARRSAIEHVLTETAVSEQSKCVYRAAVLEQRPLKEVAAELGLTYAAVKQIKSRLDRAVEAVLGRYGRRGVN